MHKNQHIANLGYRLESTEDTTLVRPLLEAAGLAVLEDREGQLSEYVMATTTAGGLAACAGWTRVSEDAAVLHSLAVAPSSRGSGVGASLMAQAMAILMDANPVEAMYLQATAARRFFASYGFIELDAEELPREVTEHPSFERAPEGTPMGRHYKITPRGLDQCAFRLLENATMNAVLPIGSVIFFHQSGQLLEANYRGGPVKRGHILGKVTGDEIDYLWHAYASNDELIPGAGEMTITGLEDGRRELQERDERGEIVLRMREA